MAKRGYKQYAKGDKYRADVYHKSYSQTELQTIHRRLAKTANERMRQLERNVSRYTRKSLASGYMYKQMESYLKSEGRKRFSESAKGTGVSDLRREINLLENFLNSKTTTIGGARRQEAKTREALEHHFPGIEPNQMNDFLDFLSSDTFKNLTKAYDSETIIDIYERASEDGLTPDEIKEAFNNFTSSGGKNLRDLTDELGVDLF